MSEPKRATLSTISTQKSDVKKTKETSKSIRFSLTLPESNEKSCPEYNYRDLLNSAEVSYNRKWLRIVQRPVLGSFWPLYFHNSTTILIAKPAKYVWNGV